MSFVGRSEDLSRLRAHLADVTSTERGRLLSVRGRRQVGKSRLVTEFADTADVPQLFFTAARHASPVEALASFARAASRSTLPGAHLFESVVLADWEAAFDLLVAALPPGPAIVALDELPWLVEAAPVVESSLQRVWDTQLEARPVLVILIGSDLTTMEALNTYGRPLFGRTRQLVIEPFTPADTAAMTDLADPAAAFDAQLVTGGYPRLCLEWRNTHSAAAFVEAQLADEYSELVVAGRTTLAAELPGELHATDVLAAIGAGERTNKAIGQRVGLPAASLARTLRTLSEDKRLVAVDQPVSTRPAREPRYRIADPYLRLWLRFVQPSLPDIARGRADLAIARFHEGWTSYRGRAVEPLVRSALDRLAASDDRLGRAGFVGGYWTRSSDLEVDLVGVDRHPNARHVSFVGSIKWREHAPFTPSDLADLAAQRQRVPGAESAPLVAVSRSGFTARDLDASYGPADLLAAW